MRPYFDPDDEQPDPEDIPEPREEAQPDHFCDCRPGTELREKWQHADTCRRWMPPLGGPGSTPEHRAAALAAIRRAIADARRRHQETQ